MKTHNRKVKQLLVAAFAWNETSKNIKKNENSSRFHVRIKEKISFYW